MKQKQSALVIAPHPDDEVLGVGGTIASLAKKGWEVTVLIATKAIEEMFDQSFIEQGRQEAQEAHKILGVSETIFFDQFPAALLDTVKHIDVNRAISQYIQEKKPDILFLPFLGDIHLDHQKLFLSGMVASRPNGSYVPRKIYTYETLSETNWNAPYLTPSFIPNTFVNISETIDLKLKAMQAFQSQTKAFPNERSLEALEALAKLRGATVHINAAEAFILVRDISNVTQL